ncbi:MAG TPA: D-Ala-D-Ala carboxypeptidase family metallohydrolase, partial [Candidatus Dojkabacteria bacterium]|nr:D-Ala-D-Ala carboxypeptidase family metallohydrolase [Candidatus Dojkabacteria bacterium]
NTKIRVLSTFRTQTHNTTIGGKPSSLHLYYRAIDWQFFGTGSKDAMKNFQNDIQSRGEVFQILRKMGIAGFGLYKNFNHIDSRNESVVPVFNNKDEYGWYSYFDYR